LSSIPPQSAFWFWIAILSASLIGVGLVSAVRGVRHPPPSSPQRRNPWLRLGMLASDLVLLVVLYLDISWQLTLDEWKGLFAQTCTTAQNAALHAKSQADALFMLLCLLMILAAGVTVYMNTARRFKAPRSIPLSV
jgi:hypothetical protein